MTYTTNEKYYSVFTVQTKKCKKQKEQCLILMFFLGKMTHIRVAPGHRKRIETENKAKCRRFGLGVKIECRTRKFLCESVSLCT